MIKYFLFILLSFNLFAQTVWYVDHNASGSNTGRSWTDAWNYLDSAYNQPNGINWSILSAGDTVYVSGGVDSTIYKPTDALYGTGLTIGIDILAGRRYTFVGDPVILCPANRQGRTTGEWANHIGEVKFVVDRDSLDAYPMPIQMMSNIKLVGFKFYDRRAVGSVAGSMVSIGAGSQAEAQGVELDSLQWLDDWEIYGNANGEIVNFIGSKGTLTNSYIKHYPNSNDMAQDMISMNSGRGGHTIMNNVIVKGLYDNTTTDSHADMIQISNVGSLADTNLYDTECLQITISGNLLIDTAANVVSYNGIIYSSGIFANQRLHVCNNIAIIHNAVSSVSGIYIGQGLAPEYNNYCDILNNTVIMRGAVDAAVPLTYWDWDSLYIYNNLLVVDTSISGSGSSKLTNGRAAGDVTANFGDIDYNFWSINGGTYRFFDNGSYLTLTQWLAFEDDLGLTDENGDTLYYGDLDLIERDSESPADYYTTAGRDLGYSIPAWLCNHNDILGNPRTGSWDIGALEYQSSGVIRKKARVMIVQ